MRSVPAGCVGPERAEPVRVLAAQVATRPLGLIRLFIVGHLLAVSVWSEMNLGALNHNSAESCNCTLAHNDCRQAIWTDWVGLQPELLIIREYCEVLRQYSKTMFCLKCVSHRKHPDKQFKFNHGSLSATLLKGKECC